MSALKLRVGPEGFVDLRRDPPADREVVNGFTPESLTLPALTVPVVLPDPVPEEAPVLPARQTTTEGLASSVAEPVKVKAEAKRPTLLRISSAEGPACYVIVSRAQHTRLAKHKWTGTKNGRMYRVAKQPNAKDVVLWIHREAARCNRADKFVALLDGDERNLVPSNLRIMNSAEEVKAIRLAALKTGGQHG